MTDVKLFKSVHSKTVICFNVGDHIKSAHTPIILHRVLCRSLKEISRCICTVFKRGYIILKYLCDQCAHYVKCCIPRVLLIGSNSKDTDPTEEQSNLGLHFPFTSLSENLLVT